MGQMQQTFPPRFFFPTADQLRQMAAARKIRDDAYIKLVTYVTRLFDTPVNNVNDIS